MCFYSVISVPIPFWKANSFNNKCSRLLARPHRALTRQLPGHPPPRRRNHRRRHRLVRHRRHLAQVDAELAQRVLFLRALGLGDHDYCAVAARVADQREPDAGVAGGASTMTPPGRGREWANRGGLRVIYFVQYKPNEMWMLTIYAKARRDDVPAHILKQLVEAFRNG